MEAELKNELTAFIENMNAKRFSKSLRKLFISYLLTDEGRNENLNDLVIDLDRIFALLDLVDQYHSVNGKLD